mmetsp:Transcript_13132/g.36275  ORF Transcript_13132/g.36275 Transcript_13132/m.36275 type:complete len:268 (-) Transcript_13132:291-1094(-)
MTQMITFSSLRWRHFLVVSPPPLHEMGKPSRSSTKLIVFCAHSLSLSLSSIVSSCNLRTSLQPSRSSICRGILAAILLEHLQTQVGALLAIHRRRPAFPPCPRDGELHLAHADKDAVGFRLAVLRHHELAINEDLERGDIIVTVLRRVGRQYHLVQNDVREFFLDSFRDGQVERLEAGTGAVSNDDRHSLSKELCVLQRCFVFDDLLVRFTVDGFRNFPHGATHGERLGTDLFAHSKCFRLMAKEGDDGQEFPSPKVERRWRGHCGL